MPSLSNINKRDETASKPDTGKYGLEPFMGATGYAAVACCPIYTIVGIVVGIVHQVKKRKQKKTGAQEEGQQEAGEKTHTTDDGLSRTEDGHAKGKGRKKEADGSASPGLKRSVSPPRVTHGFKGDPNNPRECHPECPGFKKDYPCAVHHGSKPDRPTSPGLLAV